MAQWKACVCRVVPEPPLTRSVHCLLCGTEVLYCSTSLYQATQLSFGRQSLCLWKPVRLCWRARKSTSIGTALKVPPVMVRTEHEG